MKEKMTFVRALVLALFMLVSANAGFATAAGGEGGSCPTTTGCGSIYVLNDNCGEGYCRECAGWMLTCCRRTEGMCLDTYTMGVRVRCTEGCTPLTD